MTQLEVFIRSRESRDINTEYARRRIEAYASAIMPTGANLLVTALTDEQMVYVEAQRGSSIPADYEAWFWATFFYAAQYGSAAEDVKDREITIKVDEAKFCPEVRHWALVDRETIRSTALTTRPDNPPPVKSLTERYDANFGDNMFDHGDEPEGGER